MQTFDTFSYMLFELTSGTITNGTLTEKFAGGFVSAEDVNWIETEAVPDLTLEVGEVFDDTGASGGELAANYVYRGYIDSGQAAGRLYVFEGQGSGDYIVASNENLPLAFPDGEPGGFPTTIDTSQLVTTDLAFCFSGGTEIATSGGARRVEDLRIGDPVLTADGRTVPVKWLGRQTLQKWRHGAQMQPVRIRAGALGGGLPHSDLTVTADHGMMLDGLVINASALVNGDSIDFVPLAELEDSFTVYHVETEDHDVILANGAPSETFVDAVTRSHFDNYAEYLDLYGADRIIPEMPMPRIAAARLVPQNIKDRMSRAPRLSASSA